MISTRLVAILVASAACAPVPPAPPQPRAAVSVSAPFARTWESAVDVFAERNIPIRTLDRASGLIVAEPQKVSRTDAPMLADCGSSPMGIPFNASDATWNLLVRGDSLRSTVRATVRFVAASSGMGAATVDCSTKGVWESQLEERVKASAETKP